VILVTVGGVDVAVADPEGGIDRRDTPIPLQGPGTETEDGIPFTVFMRRR